MILLAWITPTRGHVLSYALRVHILARTCPMTGTRHWRTKSRFFHFVFSFSTLWYFSRWLYALFVTIDANFHLKWKTNLKDELDLSLSQGWSYFVEELSYKSYLREHSNTLQEVSDEPQRFNVCTGLIVPNTEKCVLRTWCHKWCGHKVCCWPHCHRNRDCLLCSSRNKVSRQCGRFTERGMVHTTALMYCQYWRFARYVNMDYLFFSVLKDTPVKCINISYDIICQWEHHLWEWMLLLPSPMHLPHTEKTVVTFIPKFHLPAHIRECQWKYLFNYIQGGARTDGEAPEQGWSTLNAVASSTKEMGPGHSCDTLDDLIEDSNWKKVIRQVGMYMNIYLWSYLH